MNQEPRAFKNAPQIGKGGWGFTNQCLYLTKMAELKVVVSDPKTGKSYQKVFDNESFLGMKLKDQLDGNAINLPGYKLQITGGSDSAGFPMREDVPGTLRRKPLLTKGPGITSKKLDRKGKRRRVSVAANTVAANTAQLNVKVVAHGTKSIEELYGVQPKEAKAE